MYTNEPVTDEEALARLHNAAPDEHTAHEIVKIYCRMREQGNSVAWAYCFVETSMRLLS